MNTFCRSWDVFESPFLLIPFNDLIPEQDQLCQDWCDGSVRLSKLCRHQSDQVSSIISIILRRGVVSMAVTRCSPILITIPWLCPPLPQHSQGRNPRCWESQGEDQEEVWHLQARWCCKGFAFLQHNKQLCANQIDIAKVLHLFNVIRNCVRTKFILQRFYISSMW